MGICLLLISFACIFAIFFLLSSEAGLYTNLRRSFILSLITQAGIIFIFNETASLFNAIDTNSALFFWIIEALGMFGLVYYLNRSGKIDLSRLNELTGAFRLTGLDKTHKIVIAFVMVFYMLPLLFLAIYAAPNNFDSHMYHLNRILIWIYNGNLDHFPTMHLQQLYLNVFAEYLVLDTVLLAGSDQFSGLVQFGAFIGSICGIGLIAKKFGLGKDGQLLAAICFLTLPIGIFESTSTQVDLCGCFFFIAFVYFGFELLERKSTLALVAMMQSLAFGGFSKYTILIFAIPFAIYFGIRILMQYRLAYAMKVLAVAVALMIITFSPFFYRNYTIFGHVMHPLRGTAFASEELPANKHSVLFTLSNVIKNAGLNIGLPITSFNRVLDDNIRLFHETIGVNVDDPDLSIDPFSVKYSVHEDMIPNTIHFWLIVVAGILLLFAPVKRDVKWFWTCSALGFLLFCTLMKFQLWSTRTQMPLFAMGAIMIACVYSLKLRWKAIYLIAPLLLLSLPFVYGNPSKELVSINFITRKALGHIPIAICESTAEAGKIYEKYLSEYYEFPGKDNCHPLKRWPDYAERTKVFSLLEKVGYYDQDRTSNIISMNRDRAYFLSTPDNYLNYKALLPHIRADRNVGVMFRRNVGFYNYWSSTDNNVERPGQMDYIRYMKELAPLPNAQKKFCYEYVLSDDLTLIDSFIPKGNIARIYSSELLHLVELKRASCQKVLF
ncbi:glycosyltransferase family 39 protein [Dyadobacter sp. CY261]|uniref:ArnT family glycosyltransferase n=1 Tax=Dyadobacter sp. CY261 TaxID=2907203 RepID=UPI001F42AB41|nr:glycosyltransferase family 39 protein [Dyadobacter sp. CY261]MCF0072171.1 glycosyltransferase family 39 protein [Dyadobacter sp. CY261]